MQMNIPGTPESRMRGNVQVRLCVQVRLMCSAGVSPAGVRAEAP